MSKQKERGCLHPQQGRVLLPGGSPGLWECRGPKVQLLHCLETSSILSFLFSKLGTVIIGGLRFMRKFSADGIMMIALTMLPLQRLWSRLGIGQVRAGHRGL